MRQLNQGVENLRRTNVLEIIIDHLLEMAAQSIKFHSVVKAKSYLSQARRLCKCYHNYGCDIGAKEYLASIHNLDEDLLMIYDQEDFNMGPPSLPRRISTEPVLPEVPQNREEKDTLNLYEEMQPQVHTPENKKCLKFRTGRDSYIEDRKEMLTLEEAIEPLSPLQSPEPRKSIKFRNVIIEVQPGDKSPALAKTDEKEIKTCLKSSIKVVTSVPNDYSPGPDLSPEPRKSIKFRDKLITLPAGHINSIQKPEGYSPVSILKSKAQKKDLKGKDSADEDDELEENEKILKVIATDKQSLLPSYLRSKLKTSKDFIKTSPIGNSEIFQNISENTQQFLNHMTAEEKKAQIREMLKRKTLQLKGVFNQSSDT